MNILLMKHFFVIFMFSEIQSTLFGHFPYSVTFPTYYVKYMPIANCKNKLLLILLEYSH